MEARQFVNINKNPRLFALYVHPDIFQSYLKDLSHSDVGEMKILDQEGMTFLNKQLQVPELC